ncbi:MAG: EamA family transporter [Proteobacteria bacterium]|nr:EamA family transporter [Pseudomonadota bacterium]
MSGKNRLIALWVVLLWSLNIIVQKIAVAHLSIFVLTFLRLGSVFPLLFIFPRPEKSLWKYFLCSFFLLALYLVLFGFGLQSEIGAGLSAFFLQTQVVFVIICCFFILGEKPTWFQVMGLLISFVGVYLLTTTSSPAQVPFKGVIFLLLSCVSFGIGIALSKKYKIGSNMTDVTWLSIAAAVPLLFFCLVVEGPSQTFHSIIDISMTAVLCILFAVIFSTIWATYLWLSLLQKVPASSMTPFMLLLPVFSIILSYVFTGESVTLIQLMAGSFIILGVVFSQGLHQRILPLIGWVKNRGI